MITATIIQFLYSSFLVKFYFQLFQEKTRVLFFNQQMEPEGEISSAPRTIDSCWINNLWKQNPRKSFQKSFKRLLMCLLRSFIFALCFAKLSISSPIRTIKVAEMSASQSWEINGKKGGKSKWIIIANHLQDWGNVKACKEVSFFSQQHFWAEFLQNKKILSKFLADSPLASTPPPSHPSVECDVGGI